MPPPSGRAHSTVPFRPNHHPLHPLSPPPALQSPATLPEAGRTNNLQQLQRSTLITRVGGEADGHRAALQRDSTNDTARCHSAPTPAPAPTATLPKAVRTNNLNPLQRSTIVARVVLLERGGRGGQGAAHHRHELRAASGDFRLVSHRRFSKSTIPYALLTR